MILRVISKSGDRTLSPTTAVLECKLRYQFNLAGVRDSWEFKAQRSQIRNQTVTQELLRKFGAKSSVMPERRQRSLRCGVNFGCENSTMGQRNSRRASYFCYSIVGLQCHQSMTRSEFLSTGRGASHDFKAALNQTIPRRSKPGEPSPLK